MNSIPFRNTLALPPVLWIVGMSTCASALGALITPDLRRGNAPFKSAGGPPPSSEYSLDSDRSWTGQLQPLLLDELFSREESPFLSPCEAASPWVAAEASENRASRYSRAEVPASHLVEDPPKNLARLERIESQIRWLHAFQTAYLCLLAVTSGWGVISSLAARELARKLVSLNGDSPPAALNQPAAAKSASLPENQSASPASLPPDLQPPQSAEMSPRPVIARRTDSVTVVTAADALGSSNPAMPPERQIEHCGEVPLPDSQTTVSRLLGSMHNVPTVRRLHRDAEPWHCGAAMHLGPTRHNQEDYVVTFAVGEVSVCVLADGAGGHAYGERASYFGVLGAITSLAHTLADWPESDAMPLERAARQAAQDASFAIATHAVAAGISQQSTLRSTLIVVLSAEDRFAWAHLGDGGGWLIGAKDLEISEVLTPAKGAQRHELLSSLGPYVLGEIASGAGAWGDADLLVVASDGVADVIDPRAFFSACVDLCCELNGDLSQAAGSLLEALALSPGVSDNLSLAILGRGRAPQLRALAASESRQPNNGGQTHD